MEQQRLSGKSKLGFSGTNASVILDAIRAFAALQVFSRHWRNIFFVDYPQLTSHRHLLAVPYVFTALGHQGVLIFFVLSGFLIGGSVVRAVEEGRFHWGRYMTRRLSRLWIVLLPALVLTAVCDRIGIASHRAALLYGGIDLNHITYNVSQASSWRIFFGNLGFLQNIRVPAFGSDGALWTMSYEFWYYVMFILIWLALAKKTRPALRVLYVALLLMAGYFVGPSIRGMFPLWLMGVALLWCKPPKVGAKTRWAVTVPYLLLIAAFAKVHWLQGLYRGDYPMALATSFWMWIQLSAREQADPHKLAVRAARWVSRLAFTMYAVHEPILVLIAALLLRNGRAIPTLFSISVGAMIFLMVFAYIYAVATVTEFQTDKVRRWLERVFGFDKHPTRSRHDIALTES